MELTRRQFMKIGGAAAAAGTVASTLPEAGAVARPPVAWAARRAAEMPAPELESLLLSRAAYGARPGDYEHARDIGAAAWIEEQLDYESIDVSAIESDLELHLPTLTMTPGQILSYGQNMGGVPGLELTLATLYRMVYSPRMLYEVMVEFWTDHFNLDLQQGEVRYLKTIDDREVIRAHALGNFRDLLTASAQSPAMLSYLNNDQSRIPEPNENYAREIMELHTVGVAEDGYPYTEADVKAVAACFTGWTWSRDDRNPARYGTYEFRTAWHDNAEHIVLGQAIPSGLGEQHGHAVIDILMKHEATGRYLATKLLRRFVTDDPERDVPELIERVAQRFRETDGDIREMLRTILRSAEFARAHTYDRLSRPLDLIARAVRTSGAPRATFDLDIRRGLFQRLYRLLTVMGQRPFYWETPDGYPDTAEAWSSSATMLWRWNLGLALAGGGERGGLLGQQLVPGFRPDQADDVPASFGSAGEAVDFWMERILHRPMLAEDRAILVDYLTDGGTDDAPYEPVKAFVPGVIALIYDSPYFQLR